MPLNSIAKLHVNKVLAFTLYITQILLFTKQQCSAFILTKQDSTRRHQSLQPNSSSSSIVVQLQLQEVPVQDLQVQVVRRQYDSLLTLHAKNTNKKRGKKNTSTPRGGGRKRRSRTNRNDDDNDDNDDDDNIINNRNSNSNGNSNKRDTVPKFSTTKKLVLSFDRQSVQTSESESQQEIQPKPQPPPLRVCVVEVNDINWWQHVDNKNPFGAKLWPSSLGVAQFIASYENINKYDVLELGCGIGLVSIVAAQCGASAIASDISDTVLKLTKMGWKETSTRSSSNTKLKQSSTDVLLQGGEDDEKKGSLACVNYDLFSKEPLPLPINSTKPKLIIGTAVTAELALPIVLAQRTFQACMDGAWVIIGDDDTGNRGNGREKFLTELDRLEKGHDIKFQRIWNSSVIKNTSLGWNAKQVKLLHLNPPDDITTT